MTDIKPLETFEIFGKFYVFEKDSYESRESYLKRVRFILNKIKSIKNPDPNQISELIRLSRFYLNTKLYGCEYSKNIMNKIK